MNLRPMDESLLKTCVHNKYCGHCPLRVGCSIRYSFYDAVIREDLDFEFLLQSLELESQALVGEDIAFQCTETLRQKVYNERKLHPYFSYT